MPQRCHCLGLGDTRRCPEARILAPVRRGLLNILCDLPSSCMVLSAILREVFPQHVLGVPPSGRRRRRDVLKRKPWGNPSLEGGPPGGAPH